MRWGCDLADMLSVPGWIEASPEGTLLYEKHGFVEAEGSREGLMLMKRDPLAMHYESGTTKG